MNEFFKTWDEFLKTWDGLFFNFTRYFFCRTADISPGNGSLVSPGSPRLSSTREMEKSADRSRRTAELPDDPLAQDPLVQDPMDVDPLTPGTILIGQAGDLQCPPSIQSTITAAVGNLQEALRDSKFLEADFHSQNILDAVSLIKL